MLRLAVKAGRSTRPTTSAGWRTCSSTWRSTARAHFKPGELVKYLESIGAQFGPHVNAYTSFDETVYMLDVPTDEAGVARARLRGAERLRRRHHARRRPRSTRSAASSSRSGAAGWAPARACRSRSCKALFGASRYADRLPIGTPEILKSFPAQRLRDFYRDYYRPDRMAVIVVGDIDPADDRGADPQALRRAAGAAAGDAAGLRRFRRTRTRATSSVSDREAQGVVGDASCTSGRCASCGRSATTGGRWCEGLVYQMINARFARDRAPARRAVPRRVGRRRHAGPDGRGVRGVGARARTAASTRGLERARAGDGPRPAARVRRGGARSRQAQHARRATSAPTTSATRRRAAAAPRSWCATS